MNRIHFCERLQTECLKISVCTIDEGRAVCDLCLVAFTGLEMDFVFQVNVPGTENPPYQCMRTGCGQTYAAPGGWL